LVDLAAVATAANGRCRKAPRLPLHPWRRWKQRTKATKAGGCGGGEDGVGGAGGQDGVGVVGGGVSGAHGGTSGSGKRRRLGWIFGGSPGDTCGTENRQHVAGEEIEASPSRGLHHRHNSQGHARGESDRRLTWLLLQPRLQFPDAFYIGQRFLPPSASLRRIQHGRSAKIRQAMPIACQANPLIMKAWPEKN
jgi:hypothetical protein